MSEGEMLIILVDLLIRKVKIKLKFNGFYWIKSDGRGGIVF